MFQYLLDLAFVRQDAVIDAVVVNVAHQAGRVATPCKRVVVDNADADEQQAVESDRHEGIGEAELMDIRPDYANIERDGQLVQADPDEVAVGDIIVVRPGEAGMTPNSAGL